MFKPKLKDVLQLAGSQHKYQHILLRLLVIAWISMMFVFLSSPFLYMDPLFRCKSKGDEIIREKQACQMIDECQVVDQFTMTSSIGLYCDLQWARVWIQACFPIGSFTGLLVMNLISDTRGRRQSFLIALSMTIGGILLSLIGAYRISPIILMISQFMRGFGAESIMPLCYTICADFFSDSMRPKAIVFLNSSGGIVSIVLGVFYLMKLNWLAFTIIFQLIPFITAIVAFYFYLKQSPFILMDKNLKEQAKQVFVFIAKFNLRQKNIKQIQQIIDEYQQTASANKPSVQNVYNTIKQWKYLKTIILLILVSGISHMNYLGIAYSFAEVGLGYGFNSMMLGLVQFSSIFFVTHIVSNVPRRAGISGFFALTMLVGLTYFTPFVQHNLVISTLLIGLSRVFSVSANCLIACMQTEAFKTEIQSTAIGLIQGLGLYGAVISPFIVQMAQHIGIHPMGAIALFVSFAIWPPYFMKQTFKFKNKKQLESQDLEIKLYNSQQQLKQIRTYKTLPQTAIGSFRTDKLQDIQNQ